MALVIVLLFGWWILPASAGAPDPWHKVDVAKLYDAVVNTVAEKFFDEAKLKQLDWSARAHALRPAIVEATPEEAVRQINALLSELKTSHTALLTPDDYFYYIVLDIVGAQPDLIARRFWGSGPYYPGIGVFTRLTEERNFVDGVLEGSPADLAGLRYGDEIVSVDGSPYSPIAAFRGKIGTPVTLTIRRDATSALQELVMPVVPIRPATAFAAATVASARVIEQAGRRIGYVHVWSWDDAANLRSAMLEFDPRRNQKPLDLLILDARGRVGGNMSVALQGLELLEGGARRLFGAYVGFGRRNPAAPPPKNPIFRGRSALLINHHTRSAAEIMAHGFKRSGFGVVIGTPTAGAVSSGALYVMPGDLLLYVAVTGFVFDGQPLEGVGVSPDHLVERPLPYAAGADPVLETAIKLLTEQKPQPAEER